MRLPRPTDDDSSFCAGLDALRHQVDTRLAQLVPAADAPPATLHRAVRHALLAPGKRVRPLLAMLSAVHFGADAHRALDPACALEMVHAASLVLDDLPSMDDAALRRGQPATHRAFGEDTAILAAVALLNHAYAVIARAPHLDARARVDLVACLSAAVGFDGLVAGQLRDLREPLPPGDPAAISTIHRQKTGALFVAAVEAGARVASADAEAIAAARGFATHLGLAFQIHDDVLDQTASAAIAGKDTCKDAGKCTMATALGCEQALALLRQHVASAVAHLAAIERPGPLVRFAEVFLPRQVAA
jgi:geranylgeranyl diphosphate synthase type II